MTTFFLTTKYLARILSVGVFHAPLRNETSYFSAAFLPFNFSYVFCRIHHRLVKNDLSFGDNLSQPSILAENLGAEFPGTVGTAAGQVLLSHDQQEPNLFDGS